MTHRSCLALALVLLAAPVGCSSEASSSSGSQGGGGQGGGGQGGQGGGEGGGPSWTCSSWATSPPGACSGDCEVALDVQIRCTEAGFGLGGVRLAGNATATHLATSTWDAARVFSLTAEGAAQVPDFHLAGMPLELDGDAGGRLLAVADETYFEGTFVGGLRAQLGVPGDVRDYAVFDAPDRYSPYVDASIGPDGITRVWFVQDILEGPPWRTFSVAVLSPDGTTSAAPHAIPAGTEWVHFGLATDASTVAFAVTDDFSYQLRALEAQGERSLGAPIDAGFKWD